MKHELEADVDGEGEAGVVKVRITLTKSELSTLVVNGCIAWAVHYGNNGCGENTAPCNSLGFTCNIRVDVER